MTLTAWPKTPRVTRCAQCGRRIPRASYVEALNARVAIALCRQHARRGGGTVA